MKKWEYKMKAYDNDVLSLEEMLSRMGDEGWKVCAYIEGEWCPILIFKREKKDA